MAEETIKFSSDDELVFRLIIDGEECVLDADSSFTRDFNPGETYIIHWYVWGFKGAKYSVEFVNAKKKRPLTMTDKKDSGISKYKAPVPKEAQ